MIVTFNPFLKKPTNTAIPFAVVVCVSVLPNWLTVTAAPVKSVCVAFVLPFENEEAEPSTTLIA